MTLFKLSRIEPTEGAAPPPSPIESLGQALMETLTGPGGPLNALALEKIAQTSSTQRFATDPSEDTQRVSEDQIQICVEKALTRLGVLSPVHICVGDVPAGTLPSLRHPLCETLLLAVGAQTSVFLVGPTGSGKTTACRQVAEGLGLDFYIAGAATGAHDFLGFIDAHGRYQTTPFRQAYAQGGLFLADEIDGSDPAALLVINSALANGLMQFPDQPLPVPRHPNFRMVAAANTLGLGADRQYVGRTQLDAASLDRFVMLDWPYAPGLEFSMSHHARWVEYVQKTRAASLELGLRHIISPRATLHGSRLLEAGMPAGTMQEMALWKGIDKISRQKICEKAGVYTG